MVAIYLAVGEESMAAEVVHNNQGGTPFRSFLYITPLFGNQGIIDYLHINYRKGRTCWTIFCVNRANSCVVAISYRATLIAKLKHSLLPSDQFEYDTPGQKHVRHHILDKYGAGGG